MLRTFLALFISFTTVLAASAQSPASNIRGQVLDRQSQQPLFGATVVVVDSDPLLGTTTDMNGIFLIESVPIGRITIRITYLGYEPVEMSNLMLTGSKELILNVEMEESWTSLGEVQVVAEARKAETINEMASVSARTFSVEEAERFAGARADVARMASNYAGVRGANDATNDIVIRGNSSSGLLWRLNGVDIPNPNHFGDLGATGGPVSMLNSNVLSNSDFFTAAFPAEYGSATSGVFDLRMRSGNSQKHEFLGQVGFNGFEFGAEGPINRETRASYLVNARYSTLAVMQQIGMSVGTGTAVPEYQDLSFNLVFPNKRGSFQVFGLAGNSSIDLLGSALDTSDTEILYGGDNLDIYDRNRLAVVGANHKWVLGENTYSSLTLAYTYFNAWTDVDTVNRATREACDCDYFRDEMHNDKAFLHWFVQQKVNARHTVKAGIIANQLFLDLNSRVLRADGSYDTLTDAHGSTQLIEPYVQWQWRILEKLVLNAGAHGSWLALSNAWAAEPRAGLRFLATDHHTFAVGYGLHSKMQSPQLLFDKHQQSNGAYVAVNKKLDFTRSHHFVASHDWTPGRNWRVKTEIYYQYLFDIPVSTADANISVINFPAPPTNLPAGFETLQNSGVGRNYGVEWTVEKFMTKGFYTLATVSLFRSEYQGTGDQWHSTAWDAGYVFNGLLGKEFELFAERPDRKNHLFLLFDVKGTYAGGQRVAPIDLVASIAAGDERFDLNQGYSDQLAEYMRFDLNVGFKQLGRRITQEWTVIMQNVTNHTNAFYTQFDPQTGTVRQVNQLGLFVVPTYRITF